MYYLFLAEGFEEVEALTPVDYLRRAGIEIRTVGVTGEAVRGSHGITVKADLTIDDFCIDDHIEGVILPGGMPGVTNLDSCRKLKDAILYCDRNALLIAAICAAPSILGRMGLLVGKSAVCYPGFEGELRGADVSEKRVVRDKNYITARAAGTAAEFAFELICYIKDASAAKKIAASVLSS